MLGILGLCTILLVLIAILSKKLSPLVALVSIPVVIALLAGFTTELGGFIVDGMKSVAPTAAMFLFAILFFGVLSDAAMFKPFVAGVLRLIGQPERATRRFVLHRRSIPQSSRFLTL